MQFITLAQVLEIIDSGKLFDIEFVTADTARGTGGEMKAYSNCYKHTSQKAVDHTSRKNAAAGYTADTGTKAPNHKENSTKNIYLTRERKIRKVHIRLITRFNGLQVS